MDHAQEPVISGDEKLYCTRCGAGSTHGANFCMRCGMPQSAEVVGHRLTVIQDEYRRAAQGLMFAVGVVFMGLLLWMALSSSSPPWDDLLFWIAAAGVVTAFVIVPQVVWRDKAGKADRMAWLMMLAPTTIAAGFGLLIWWGGRVAYTLTLGNESPLTQGAAIILTLCNAALSLGFAYATDGAQETKPGWQRARTRMAALIGAQLLLNLVAEVLWQTYN